MTNKSNIFSNIFQDTMILNQLGICFWWNILLYIQHLFPKWVLSATEIKKMQKYKLTGAKKNGQRMVF